MNLQKQDFVCFPSVGFQDSEDKYTHMPMQLRLQGNAEARGGDLKAAERVYSQALELDIPQGKHLLHANRAGVRLTLGNAEGALHDAQAAVQLAPPNFTTAYIRQVGCFARTALPCPALSGPAPPCPACPALPCPPPCPACPALPWYAALISVVTSEVCKLGLRACILLRDQDNLRVLLGSSG